MADPINATPAPIEDGYPVVLRLTGRAVLVVGGGAVGLRKAKGLFEAGAVVTVVAPDLVDGFAALDVEIVRRAYRSSDIDGKLLVVAATDDPEVQQQIFDGCERAGIFVNAADDPERCSFILPAIHRSGPVIVAVSTQGRSPALAAQLRDRLARLLPEELEQLAEDLAARRRAAHERGESTEDLDWSGLLD